MFRTVSRTLFAYCIALALATALPPHGLAVSRQNAEQKDEKKDKPEKNDKKENKKDKDKRKDSAAGSEIEKQAKQATRYQEIRDFSNKEYIENLAFRQAVDQTYRQKLREHSEYAFSVNTQDAQDDRVTRTGDKLKLEDSLYDNPLVQDYVNRVGQAVVPMDSTRLFAFKVTLNPIPEARSLSTGTVYISSGLLSAVDNEAQLAYVLGHEIAHIQENHWFEDVLVGLGNERYNEKQNGKKKTVSSVASFGGTLLGSGAGGSATRMLTALLAQVAIPSILKLTGPDAVVAWDTGQEDKADELAVKYMFDRSYDPREVRKFYEALQHLSQRDSRSAAGFMAESTRVGERLKQVGDVVNNLKNPSMRTLYQGAIAYQAQRQTTTPASTTGGGKGENPERDLGGHLGGPPKAIIDGPLSDEVIKKLEAGELIGTSGEFAAVMAELKRDNGIRAYYYDMFEMSRENLKESLLIRNNDPVAHYYYGKVLKLTARSVEEKKTALAEFVTAIKLDERRILGESRFFHALALIDARNFPGPADVKVPVRTEEIVNSLKDYVYIFQSEHGGQLPSNMDVIYDYLQEVDERGWVARPAMNVSTANVASFQADPTTPAPRSEAKQ